jgi:malto-oligosyltrehalose trehalohydrolase
VEEDGRVRFRLWAPTAGAVALQLEGESGPRHLEMQKLPAGWYELVTPLARAGSLYRFRIDGDLAVPDPASRYQPDDVDGPSEVVDPRGFDWPDAGWVGRPWEEAVIYELHVGSFTLEGSFRGIVAKLDHLRDLGVTAIELMPVADFAGSRSWGYDGVLPFAPDSRYGRPEDLKALVAEAHARGLMVFLDVVYNHFGPRGNYLHAYAEPFFTDRHHTPWGKAINFDGEDSGPVRSFFIHNAIYWLLEYNLDGLRFDAVHAIKDDSGTPFLQALATEARAALPADRLVHLVLENDDNSARLLERTPDGRPAHYTAQWNDDLHHALHVALTGESGGYYEDYAERPAARVARCLTQGFDYQGEPSAHREGRRRGEPSGHLPPTAFVNFLQNHDQVGNRAFGERLAHLVTPEALRLAMGVLLLTPPPPMLFMGEEWAASQTFPFFCDFDGELGEAVREGRRREFAAFPQFADPEVRDRIPDPLAFETFRSARLDWQAPATPLHGEWLEETRRLLKLRREIVVPLLKGAWHGAEGRAVGAAGLSAIWRFAAGELRLLANLSGEAMTGVDLAAIGPEAIWQVGIATAGELGPWAGVVGYRRSNS